MDEPSYLQGGLQLIEGLPPPLHYAPDGPETWIGWVDAGLLSARYAIFPTAEERQQPLQLRPFVAVNHALFDLYHDMRGLREIVLAISIALSLLAVAAGFSLGRHWSGLPGALLLGGLLAFTPVIVEHVALAKPYSMAWSFSIMSCYFAVIHPTRRGRTASAVLLGLAIASRVEMLGLLPFSCALLWSTGTRPGAGFRVVARFLVIVAIAALLAAPWLLTNLIGNLRAIATVRFGPPPGGTDPALITFWKLIWGQGLLISVALLVGGIIAFVVCLRRSNPNRDEGLPESLPDGHPRRGSGPWWFIILYTLFLLTTIFRQTGYGMRHHGPVLIALMVVTPLALASLTRIKPHWSGVLAVLGVIIPLSQSVRFIYEQRHSYVPDNATAWIEAHAPPGSIVYLSQTLHDPLPTPESADAMWDEVMNRSAADRKFQAGLTRFGINSGELPRALSEQNMVVERATVRRWFLLGSRGSLAGPRFNVRTYQNSATFGVRDPVPEFLKTGGFFLWRGAGPATGLADPIKTWVNAAGNGTYIYCSPEFRGRLAGDLEK